MMTLLVIIFAIASMFFDGDEDDIEVEEDVGQSSA
jgi:hypothetical protein